MELEDEHEHEDRTTYQVVMNEEEMYSIWPAEQELPPGWKAAGKTGPKLECLGYIDEVWTDMRPKSLREEMERQARERVAAVDD